MSHQQFGQWTEAQFERVREIVSSAARHLVGADGVTFVLRDGDDCVYMEEEAIGPLWKGKRFPMRDCISGWVMTHGQPVVVPDIFKDPRIPIEAYLPTFVRSLAMVPIGKERPIGAIGAYWATTGHHATDSQLETLVALADSAGLALEG